MGTLRFAQGDGDFDRDDNATNILLRVSKVMKKAPLHVAIVYDLPEWVHVHREPSYLLNHDERPTERDVARSLKRLGVKLSVFGVFENAQNLLEFLEAEKPNVVFNLCETYRGQRSQEGNIAALIDLAGIPFTGSPSGALHLCKNKATTKMILGYEGIRVPDFFVVRRHESFALPSKLTFPVIVKPLDREASEGIAQSSVAQTRDACAERIHFIRDRLDNDVIVEEFIHGREFYVGVLDGEVPMALPPRELFFAHLAADKPMIATYRAKWDDEYRARWGISTGAAAKIDDCVLKRIKAESCKIFTSLGLKGYARMDWRVDREGTPVFIEANPNPALAQNDDFALAAKMAGFGYGALITRILELTLAAEVKDSAAMQLLVR